MEILQAERLREFPWLIHGFSTRSGGTSQLSGQPDGRPGLNLGHTDWDARGNVLANRAAFLAALGSDRMELVTLRQLHSALVRAVDAVPPSRPAGPRGDALITRAPGLLLAVQTADCLPILLADTRRKAIAAIHAGWRGTLARIVEKTLGNLRMLFGTKPADVVAVIGPGIGPCCYEVGSDVAQAYASQFAGAAEWFQGPFSQLAACEEANPLPWLSKAPPGHELPLACVKLDLMAANRRQLLDARVLPENVIASSLCTSCRTDLLFSHRREGRGAGRMMAVIGCRAQ